MTRIGLEVHCQLTSLSSKLFCACRADYRGMAPNENVCPTCAGLPGSLPRLNAEAVRKALLVAIALNCEAPREVSFVRKNYFYPDLPKNFQITQSDLYAPACIGSAGHVLVGERRIGIARVQLEEDPGRIVYAGESARARRTMVDYNRSGAPLIEIVTEPDFGSPGEVRAFLNLLRDALDNLAVSDVSLEGAMRADANVSLEGGERVEIKNVGSFYDLERAVRFELVRQQSLAERGIAVRAETRWWDEKRKSTVPARTKESAEDYRYILERNIPVIDVSGSLAALRESMPESIASRTTRYTSEYGLSAQVAEILASQRHLAELFEEARSGADAREVANLITTDLLGLLDTREKQRASPLRAHHLADIARAIADGTITRASAKTALQEIARTGRDLGEVVSEMRLGAMDSGADLERIVDSVMSSNEKAVSEARRSPKAVHYIVGLVMKESGGRADARAARALIDKKLAA